VNKLNEALLSFYYQFHAQQHYFLCHDILEEAWKEQPDFTKEDAVVSLILCATGCYHFRRGNCKGAATLFKRASRVANHNLSNLEQLGLKKHKYIELLAQLEKQAAQNNTFQVVELPLLKSTKNRLKSKYPDYQLMTKINDSPYIYDHHLLRDRHAVELARNEALKRRKLK